MELSEHSKNIKFLLISFLLTLTIGVTIGLIFVMDSTHLTPNGTIEHYNGSAPNDEFDIPEHYPKPIKEMLMTTHSHIISFGLIFLALCFIFSQNSIVFGSLKTFLIIEPFISIIATFGGIWLLRFVHSNFVYLIIASGILMYFSFYFMVFISLVDLLKNINEK